MENSRDLMLADGTRLFARRLVPGDAAAIQRGLADLSPESQMQRFHTGMPRLSRTQLRYLAEVDQVHHLAWGVLDPLDSEGPGVAVVRCIQIPTAPDEAEFAVTVADKWHRRGLGTLLIRLIAKDASEHGIRTLVGQVQHGNDPMHRLLDRLGAGHRDDEGIGTVRTLAVSALLADS